MTALLAEDHFFWPSYLADDCSLNTRRPHTLGSVLFPGSHVRAPPSPLRVTAVAKYAPMRRTITSCYSLLLSPLFRCAQRRRPSETAALCARKDWTAATMVESRASRESAPEPSRKSGKKGGSNFRDGSHNVTTARRITA